MFKYHSVYYWSPKSAGMWWQMGQRLLKLLSSPILKHIPGSLSYEMVCFKLTVHLKTLLHFPGQNIATQTNQEAEQLRFCNSKRAITYKNRSCINLHQEWVNFIRKHSDGVTWTWARRWMQSGRNWISVMGSVDKWWSVASWCFEWKKYHCLELWSINSRFSKNMQVLFTKTYKP